MDMVHTAISQVLLSYRRDLCKSASNWWEQISQCLVNSYEYFVLIVLHFMKCYHTMSC